MDSLIFDGLELNAPGRKYLLASSPDFGSDAVVAQLATGQYRLEEYDHVAAALNLTRTVVIPLRIDSTSADQLRLDQQAITSRLAAANRFVPKTLTWTPEGASAPLNFRVYGGSYTSSYDRVTKQAQLIFGTLTLVCDWVIRGALQSGGSLGSSGAPILSNISSPATATLTPTGPDGDLPGDVTVFVKNRSASPIRSLIVGAVSGNTSWTPLVDNASWTADTFTLATGVGASVLAGDRFGSPGGAITANTWIAAAHFTAPTLPSDRRFMLLVRMAQSGATTHPTQLRARIVSGGTQVTGEGRSLPGEMYAGDAFSAAELGVFYFPPGSVGSIAGAATTVYLEAKTDTTSWSTTRLDFALFVPNPGTMIFETADTSLSLAAAGATIQLESNQLYDSTGAQLGGAVTGGSIRCRGTSRFLIHTSQGFRGTVDTTLPWGFEPVDVWFQYTPRYLHA